MKFKYLQLLGPLGLFRVTASRGQYRATGANSCCSLQHLPLTSTIALVSICSGGVYRPDCYLVKIECALTTQWRPGHGN